MSTTPTSRPTSVHTPAHAVLHTPLGTTPTTMTHTAPPITRSLEAPRWLAPLGTVAIVSTAMLAAGGPLVGTASDVPIVAALGIAVGIVRWQPSLHDDPPRAVPTALVLLLLVVSIQLWLMAIERPSLTEAVAGPLVTVGTLGAYLVCFGFRSPFLLRRLAVFGALMWAPVSRAVDDVVRTTLRPLSDLVYRRLGAAPGLSVDERPWRLFSAMTDRGTLVVVAVLVWGIAVSRRRLSAGGVVALSAAALFGMIVHHAIVLASPIERYVAPRWVAVATGPLAELTIAAVAVVVVSMVARRRRVELPGRPTPSVAEGRDPVIFGAPGDESTIALVLRLGVVLVPIALLITMVPALGGGR